MKAITFTIIMAVLALFAAPAEAQSVHSASQKLKTTDLGNQQLYYAPDTHTYFMMLKTGHTPAPYVSVMLGEKEEALNLLDMLLNTKVQKGGWIDLENNGENVFRWDGVQYQVSERGNPWEGRIRKANIKGFIKTINEHQQ